MTFPAPTSTSTSSIPSVKKALFDAFVADPALGAASPKVGVYWAKPNFDHDIHAVLYFATSTSAVDFATMGRGPMNRDENATIAIGLQVFREGVDAYKCEQRWWTLRAAIEDVLLVQPSPADVSWGRLATTEQDTETYSDGVLCTGTLTVDVYDRLR